MLQKYFSLQVNKPGDHVKTSKLILAFSVSGALAGCAFPLLRIPALALPGLAAHADVGFFSDGSVKLWFSSEGSPIRVYKPTVAFKPKGISS